MAFICFLFGMLLPLRAWPQPGLAQDTLHRQPLRKLALVAGTTYTASQLGLYTLWYRQQPAQRFRFFDDSREWKQMDKLGHAYSAFHLSELSANALRATGLSSRKSIMYGSLSSFLLMLPIEIMDGFSAAYGASWSDLLANAAGAALSGAQWLAWHERRIHPKFSFRPTPLAVLRPKLLGNTWYTQLFKDYNGQTYWYSIDVYAFRKTGSRFPKCLNLALGYGAYQMLYARDQENEEQGLSPYRVYYLALDIDLSHYRKPPVSLGNRLWNTGIHVINLIHLPAPALRYREGHGFTFHPLFF